MQLRDKVPVPKRFRDLRKAVKEGFSPDDVDEESGAEMYRVIAEREGLPEREVYGWMLGYPPDFGVVM